MDGVNPEEWAVHACWMLVKRQDHIEDALQREGRLPAFQQQIRLWNSRYLEDEAYQPKDAAAALYEICSEFDIVDLVGSPPHTPVATRGVADGRESGAGMNFLFAEVARVFLGKPV